MKIRYYQTLLLALGAIAFSLCTSSQVGAQPKQTLDKTKADKTKVDKAQSEAVVRKFWSGWAGLMRNLSDKTARNTVKNACNWPFTLMGSSTSSPLPPQAFLTSADFDKLIETEARMMNVAEQPDVSIKNFTITNVRVNLVSDSVTTVISNVPFKRLNPRFGTPRYLEGRTDVVTILHKNQDRKTGRETWKIVLTSAP